MVELSVHLITYNNEAFIKETLDSILNQITDFNYEIIIGDDHSTDDTWNIVDNYVKRYPNKILAKQNKAQLGILKNYKTTLDRCKGNYIFDIAGDDFLHDNRALDKIINHFKQNDHLGFIDCGYNRFDQKLKTTEWFINQSKIKSNEERYKTELLLGHIVPIGVTYNRKLLYDFVDFAHYLTMGIDIEDYPMLVDMAMNTEFDRIEESLVTYRVHDDSYSHKRTFESHYSLYEQMNSLFNYFKSKYNISTEISKAFQQNTNKHLLFLAGYFEKPEIGKTSFNKVSPKGIRDYIHYWASQSSLFRKMIKTAGQLKKI